jgi:hypothetical protein
VPELVAESNHGAIRSIFRAHSGGISVSEHKYRVGQAVEFFPERGVEHTAKGRFKIVRLFLGEGNAPRYRIKHEVDGHERMVGEGELGPR